MDDMPHSYTISELEKFSGIKAHTIRIWEQRYELLSPNRTKTNLRRYDDEDLRRLLNVAALNKMGYKISRIADMAESEIESVIRADSVKKNKEQHVLNILKIAMLNFDEELFTSGVLAYEQEHGRDPLIHKVLLPFLVQIGVLWQTRAICPAHEHFISNLIRQFFQHAIKSLPNKSLRSSPTFVLYLPAGELHEIGLLLIHYTLRKMGRKSVYLGQSLPVNNLEQVCTKIVNPCFVSYLTAKGSTKGFDKLVGSLAQNPKINSSSFHFIVSPEDFVNPVSPEEFKVHNSSVDFLKYVEEELG
jgi:MerR family transcriptional regulator, light-induced transcriptional regulator